jgi:hypothetical protein
LIYQRIGGDKIASKPRPQPNWMPCSPPSSTAPSKENYSFNKYQNKPLTKDLMSISDQQLLSETVKNYVEAIVALGGVSSLLVWLYSRKDRAADVLLLLEKEFGDQKVQEGLKWIDNNTYYDQIKNKLIEAIEIHREGKRDKQIEPEHRENIEQLDALLHFYLVLSSIRAAGQVPDKSLRCCFNYWLTRYFDTKRVEFQEYVNYFYPTLKRWLLADQEKKYVWQSGFWQGKFFKPEDFEWGKNSPSRRTHQLTAETSSTPPSKENHKSK